ncbi:MAG TPA: transglycosylase domain-containing protein [Ktedonobacterales bacterium]|nr:transglycosylase domain-containing protein [Ktedonobacterales bacterium]
MDTTGNTPFPSGNDAEDYAEREQPEQGESASPESEGTTIGAPPSEADADTPPAGAGIAESPDIVDVPTRAQPAVGQVAEMPATPPVESYDADGVDASISSDSVDSGSVAEPDDTLPIGPSAALNGARPAPAQSEDEPIADWPAFAPPSVPLRDPRTRAVERRWSRRRRRYTLYVRRTSRARQAHRSRSLTRAAWITVIAMGLVIFSIVGGSAAAAASYYNSEVNLLHGLQRGIAAKDSVRIFDDKGVLLYQFNQDGAQHSIALAQIPVDVVNATVAIEDHDFWVNNGVDFTSIVRAASDDLKTHKISQGGSTITQQLIKEQILGGNVNFQRKLNEAILSIGITESGTYSKSQIMQMYLDSIPYSPTAYGIDAAAQEYFGYKDDLATGETAAQHLDLAQASMLAGIPQNPNLNDPLLHPESGHHRQGDVLKAMVQYGYITSAQANAAWQESLQPHFYHHTTTEQNLAPHFVYYVINQIQQMIDTGQLHQLDRSGLNIYTTLDMSLQNQAQQAMRDHLYGNDQTGYCCGLIRNSNVSNAAEIIADQHTGAIKVYVGSIDYYSTKINGKFDVVSDGYRGPGSSFKPFVYATAMEKGWFPAITIGDIPTIFWDAGSGTQYKPLDYDTTHMNAEVTARTALDWSLNVPAIKAMQYAGVDNVKTQVARMGMTKTVGTWGLSSVLGAIQVTPFEMAQAYTVFANYGQFIPLYAIDSITDSAGNVLFKYAPPQPVQVMDPRIAFMMTSILSDNASRAGDFGPCAPLYLDEYHGPGVYRYGTTEGAGGATAECGAIFANHFLSSHAWPTAAKTGTGQDFKDDWTVGYTMDYTAAVWVGNNNDTPMYGIDGVTGAAPIFYQSMLYAEESQNLAKRPFPVPNGVHQAKYCSNSVCTTDWFLNGPMPPSNIGENGTSIPCVQVLSTGGWSYGPPCQISLIDKVAKNNGAPPPVTINGQQYIGGVW